MNPDENILLLTHIHQHAAYLIIFILKKTEWFLPCDVNKTENPEALPESRCNLASVISAVWAHSLIVITSGFTLGSHSEKHFKRKAFLTLAQFSTLISVLNDFSLSLSLMIGTLASDTTWKCSHRKKIRVWWCCSLLTFSSLKSWLMKLMLCYVDVICHFQWRDLLVGLPEHPTINLLYLFVYDFKRKIIYVRLSAAN